PEGSKKSFAAWKKPLELSDERQAMAFIHEVIQDPPPGLELGLEVTDAKGANPRRVSVGVVQQEGMMIPNRGLALQTILGNRRGDTIAESASMAWSETGRALTSVYRFLYRLGSGDIPVAAMGGPVTIAKASYLSALEGFPTLLLFLTLISANLAVVNFLPIPVLDGGHMVFLAYEGIVGRPPNEQ